MNAKDIMTKKVLTLGIGAGVFEAIDLLVNNKISGAPVVDREGNIVGIVTEKDLLVILDFMGKKDATNTTIDEFMTRDIIAFSEDTPIKPIMQELVRKNIKRAPIVKDNKVVGIVSRRDILRAMRER